MTIVLATRNKKKIQEIKRIFAGFNIHFLSLDSFPDCPEVLEDGKTFRSNSVKKAITVTRNTGYPALADDSGLEVDALGRSPGVFSARYAGNKSNDRNNLNKLLREMRNLKNNKDRGARFVCCIAYAMPDKGYRTFTGMVKGIIGKEKKGDNGFGYDPVFYPSGYEKTFAEMADSEKDILSHRGIAMRKFFNYLRKIMY